MILSLADRYVKRHDARYPVGRCLFFRLPAPVTYLLPFSHARPERGWKRSACWAARASCRVRPPHAPSLRLSPHLICVPVAAVEVVQYSVIDLVAGLRGRPQRIEVTPTLYVVLSVGTAAKVALYLLCRAARAAKASDTLGALAEDHLSAFCRASRSRHTS